MKMNKRKLLAVIISAMLAAGVVLSGTFAWQSLSQVATNEISSRTSAGARLHDMFNGQEKKVFVENFGEHPVYVRIRLREYMEYGKDAGVPHNTTSTKITTTLTTGTPLLDDPATWTIHKPNSNATSDDTTTTPDFHNYFTWGMGGSVVYLPTFNMNPESQDADIKGSYKMGYTDYKEYEAGKSVTGTEILSGGIQKPNQSHTTTDTPPATVEMLQANGAQAGAEKWVYDTDGWAYYAKPIAPHTASGLLLDKITQNKPALDALVGDDEWYYGIHVEAQFVTQDEIGSDTNRIGFYDAVVNSNPSPNAKQLLDAMVAANPTTRQAAPRQQATQASEKLEIKTANQTKTIAKGGMMSFTAQAASGQTITWSVQGANDPNTSIDQKGNLAVANDETASRLTVIAECENGDSGSYTLDVQGKE